MRLYSSFKVLLIGFVIFSVGACAAEPEEKISEQLLRLSNEEARTLLLSKVDSLSKWHAEMSNLRDSDNKHLFDNALVQDLYKNPYSHFQLTMKMMSESRVSDDAKLFLVRLSQCLSVNDYLQLGGVVFDSVVAGQSGEAILKAMVSPGAEWGTLIALNYTTKDVEAFLLRIRENKAMKNMSPEIERILNGTRADFIRSYVKAGEHFPVLSCK